MAPDVVRFHMSSRSTSEIIRLCKGEVSLYIIKMFP
jgi:hypothetical protein